jgi:hypothetical protein
VTVRLTVHVRLSIPELTVTMLVYVPTARPVGFTESVRYVGVVLLLREADNQVAPSVCRVTPTGAELKTEYTTGNGKVPPI